MTQKLLDFLQENHIQFREGGTHQHVRHGWIGFHCHWCGSQNWHLGVRLADGYTTCWRCGRKSLFELLAILTKCPKHQIVEVVNDVRGGSTDYHIGSRVGGRTTLPPGVESMMPPHRRYLQKRGFLPLELEDVWGVRGIGFCKPLSWRLFIPIKLHGEIVSWTTRAIGAAQPRYISASPEQETIEHKNLLYGADLANHGIVVVEGPTDAWAIGPGAVATMGLEVSSTQLHEIGAYPSRAICFDNSDVARKRAEKLARRLEDDHFPGETHLIELETGDDPADCDPMEIEDIRRKFIEIGIPSSKKSA